jgi:hypothetical protein
MKRVFTAGLSALALLPSLAMAQVVIVVRPPAPIVERPGPPPGRLYVWVGGYHRWDGRRYVWVSGHYALPPRPGMVWVPAHYDARPRGYVLVAGHWR